MFPRWLHTAWSWLIRFLSGAGAVQVTPPKPEPVQEQAYPKTIYYVLYGEAAEPKWQNHPNGGYVVAKMDYNDDGECRLTVTNANEANLHYIVATATFAIVDAIGNHFMSVGEILWVDSVV